MFVLSNPERWMQIMMHGFIHTSLLARRISLDLLMLLRWREHAKIMFQLSVEQYKLCHMSVLCDGDAKTISSLNNEGIYMDEILKEDCVNHVNKRLYKSIEKAKQDSKGTKHHLSGKGKVTKELRKRSNSYAKALKDRAPDVKKM